MNNIGNTSPRPPLSFPSISSPRPVTIKSVKGKNIVEDTNDLIALSDSDSDSEESSRGIKRKWDGQEIGELSVPSTEINLTQTTQIMLYGEASQSLQYRNLLYNNRLSEVALTDAKKTLLEIKEKVFKDATNPIHGYEIRLPIVNLLEVRYKLSQFDVKLKSALENNNLSEERQLLFHHDYDIIRKNIILLSGNINVLSNTRKEYNNLSSEKFLEFQKMKSQLDDDIKKQLDSVKDMHNIIDYGENYREFTPEESQWLKEFYENRPQSSHNELSMQMTVPISDIESLYVDITQNDEKFKETDIENLKKIFSFQKKVDDNSFTDEGLGAIMQALNAQWKEQEIFDAIPERILEIKNNDEDDTTKIQRMSSLALYRNALRESVPEYVRYIEELIELHKEF